MPKGISAVIMGRLQSYSRRKAELFSISTSIDIKVSLMCIGKSSGGYFVRTYQTHIRDVLFSLRILWRFRRTRSIRHLIPHSGRASIPKSESARQMRARSVRTCADAPAVPTNLQSSAEKGIWKFQNTPRKPFLFSPRQAKSTPAETA